MKQKLNLQVSETKTISFLSTGKKRVGVGDTFFFLPRGGVAENRDICEKLNKAKEGVFPYRYKYLSALDCYDHHVGEDGWSL